MNARRMFALILAGGLACGMTATTAWAQFGLDRLKQGLDKAKSAAERVTQAGEKATDTAKDAAKVAKGVTGIGPEEERLIGESVAMEIAGQYGGILRDETITRRVNLLGRSIAYYSTRPVLDWKFAVLDSPSVNGFSAPGGWVFLTRGLYEKVAASDDQLAAVLAHEIAHVTERHALKIIARAEFVAGASSMVVKRSSDAARLQAQMSQFDTGIASIVKTLLERGFDPQTEFAADKSGRALAVTLGYAPGGLRHVLSELQREKRDPKTTFSTHPSLAERIRKLPTDPAP